MTNWWVVFSLCFMIKSPSSLDRTAIDFGSLLQFIGGRVSGVTWSQLGSLICLWIGWDQNIFISPSSKWCRRSQGPIISQGRSFLEPWNFWQVACSFQVTQHVLFPTENTKQCFSGHTWSGFKELISLCRFDLWDLSGCFNNCDLIYSAKSTFSPCAFPQMNGSSWDLVIRVFL